MRNSSCILSCFVTSSLCFAQSLSVGVIGGAMTTNDLSSQWVQDVSTRYAIGPQLDLGLPLGFSVEADALYRNESYQTPQWTSNLILQHPRTSWEFPILLKKTLLPLPVVKPFIEAGWVPRDILSSTFTPSSSSQGLVIGAGVQLGIGRLRLSPALRYTRWNNAPALIVFANGPTISLTQNQVDVLIGLSWKLH